MQYYINEDITLTNENIRSVVKTAEEAYLTAAGKRANNPVKFALSVEEALLRFQDNFGTEALCSLRMHKSFGRIILNISHKGTQKNPIATHNSDNIEVNILERLDIKPKYHYTKNETNVVTIIAEQKPRSNTFLLNLAIAVALAFLCYFIVGFFPESVQTIISQDILSPVFKKMIEIITAVSTPMVFLAVINSISNMGDINAVGKMGKRYLSGMMLDYLIAGIVFTAIALLVFDIRETNDAVTEGITNQIVQLILNIIPSNAVSPFTTDNAMQVIVIAVLIGVSLVRLQEKVDIIKQFFLKLGDLVNYATFIVLKIIPFIVFAGIFNILMINIQGTGKFLYLGLTIVAAWALYILYITLRTCHKLKMPFKVFFNKQTPTLLINITTSSQVSALPESLRCCKEDLGMDERLTDFALPLSLVLYMPCGACFLGLLCYIMAEIAGVPVSAFQVVNIFLMAIIVALAAPPVPGSALIVMSIMLSIVNTPAEYFPVAVLIASIFGHFLPALNGYSMQLNALLIAQDLNMLDHETLIQDKQ